MLTFVLSISVGLFIALWLMERDLARKWEELAREAQAVAEMAVGELDRHGVLPVRILARKPEKEWKQ